MKQIRLLIIVLLSVAFTGSLFAQEAAYYGKKIDEKDAMSMARLEKAMEGKDSLQVKVTGTVVECCQAKGCWMTIDKGDGTTMRVRFKDYGFFVPKDSGGKTAVMEGTAMVQTISVDEQRHYAEDAGKSKAEIKSIKEPSRQLVFVADGVILK